MKKRRFKKSKRLLQTACLAVGLTLAGWSGGPAVNNANASHGSMGNYSGWVTPDHNLNNVYIGFSYYVTNSSTVNTEVFEISDSINADNTEYFNGILYGDIWTGEGIEWGEPIEYVVLGVYDNANDLVTVGFDDDWYTNALGKAWNNTSVFGDAFGWTESDIATALEDGDYDVLQSFIVSYFNYDQRWADNGETSTLVQFSNGALGGTAQATASAVPIPGAVWLLGSGLFGLVAIRRRKKS